MSETPRTDAELLEVNESEADNPRVAPDSNGTLVNACFARQLERELAAVTAERDDLASARSCHQPELCEEVRWERDDLRRELAAAQAELAAIKARFREIATTTQPDYPRIAEIECTEQLWAIEGGISGTALGLEDTHKDLAESQRMVDALIGVLKTERCPDTLTENRCKLVDNKITCAKCWREWALQEARQQEVTE